MVQVLRQHHFNVQGKCLICPEDQETIDHLFISCSWTRACWFGLSIPSATIIPASTGLSEWMNQLFSLHIKSAPEIICAVVIAMDNIWWARNQAK